MNAKLNFLSKHKENRPFCAGQATRTLTAVITVLLAMTAATAQAHTVTIEGTLAYESDGVTERRDVIGGTAVIRTGWHELNYITYTSWTYDANDYSAKAVAIPAPGYKFKEWLVNGERDRNDVLSPRSSETSIKQISADVKLTAEFQALAQWNPSVSINGWNYGGYDAEQNAPTLSGMPDGYTGTVIYKYATDAQAADADWSTIVPVKPGTYYVKAIAGADNNYSECTSNTAEFNIGKRLVTLDTDNYSVEDKEYDGTAAATFTGTPRFSDGMIINNDQVSITSVTGHFASKNVVHNVGNDWDQLVTITEVVLGGTDAGNYEVDLSGLIDYGAILPKTLTVEANGCTIEYGEEPDNDGVTYDGFIDGENENVQGVLGGELDFDYSYTVGDPVDYNYTITPKGLSSNNYKIEYVYGILTVDKKYFSIDWDETSFTYDGSAHVPEPTFDGLLDQDVDNVSLDIVISGSNTTSGEAVNVGEYTATVNGIEGSAAGNYYYDGYLVVDFEIEQKELTVSGNDKAINFGEEAANADVTYDGFVEGEGVENLEGDLIYTYRNANGEYGEGNNAVGTYQIIPSGLTSANYKITFVPGTLTVKQKATITVVWNDGNNLGSLRPESLDFKLLANGSDTETVTLNENNNWMTTVSGLTGYNGEDLIEYTWSLVDDLSSNYESDETQSTTNTGATATFTYTRETGNLIVKNIVVSDLAADSNVEFTFTVPLSGTTINGTFGDMTFENGVATVVLKGGESKTATGLPTDLTYTVMQADADGFELTGKTGDTGTISTTMSEAVFTNTRETGDLVLTNRVVSDIEADTFREFTFTITLSDETISGTYGYMEFENGVAANAEPSLKTVLPDSRKCLIRIIRPAITGSL